MSLFRIAAMSLCVLLFFAWGCTSTQGGKNAWKGTSIFYNRHVNKPATLEFDTDDPLKAYQAVMVEAVADIDFQLEELLRAMDDSDRSPDEEWARALLKRFPWLRGTFIADGRGRLMSRVPASHQPLPDLALLLGDDPKQRPSDLRAAVLPGADGPEIYLSKPVYLQSDLRVVIICHFDLRSLLARYGQPEKLMVVSGDNVLWSGLYNFAETPLSGANWNKLGLKKIDGTLQNQTGEFYWLASFFANIQLVYATPAKGDFSVNPRQMTVLKSQRFAGAVN